MTGLMVREDFLPGTRRKGRWRQVEGPVPPAAEALRQSNADGVMIGRGCYGRPWLLARAASYLTTGEALPEPDLATQYAILLRHYRAMLDHHGTNPGVRLARKHLAWYSKGQPGSAEFRVQVNRAETPEAVEALLHEFYTPLIEQGVEAVRDSFRDPEADAMAA